MASPFDITKVYSFDVYPSSILGTNFQNVTILSIMDYESALAFQDIAALHVNIYPTLPPATPDDPTATDYVRIRTASGARTILGMSWINLATIEQIDSRKASVLIDGISSSMVNQLRNTLIQGGFNILEIKLI
jgi:hypothetical protein